MLDRIEEARAPRETLMRGGAADRCARLMLAQILNDSGAYNQSLSILCEGPHCAVSRRTAAP